jgi:energy-converting hydrogenase Eha subunit A
LRAAALLPWPVLAAFAIGAAMAVAAQLIGERGVELAALAAVFAGMRTLAAALPGLPRLSGKPRARASTIRHH